MRTLWAFEYLQKGPNGSGLIVGLVSPHILIKMKDKLVDNLL